MKARRSIPHIKKEIKKEKEVHSKEKVNITQYVLSKDKDIKEQIEFIIHNKSKDCSRFSFCPFKNCLCFSSIPTNLKSHFCSIHKKFIDSYMQTQYIASIIKNAPTTIKKKNVFKEERNKLLVFILYSYNEHLDSRYYQLIDVYADGRIRFIYKYIKTHMNSFNYLFGDSLQRLVALIPLIKMKLMFFKKI